MFGFLGTSDKVGPLSLRSKLMQHTYLHHMHCFKGNMQRFNTPGDLFSLPEYFFFTFILDSCLALAFFCPDSRFQIKHGFWSRFKLFIYIHDSNNDKIKVCIFRKLSDIYKTTEHNHFYKPIKYLIQLWIVFLVRILKFLLI